MLRLQKKVTPAKKNTYPHPDKCTSTVKAVEQPEGYADGNAVKITYEMTDSSGNHFLYHEIFRTKEPVGQRSKIFFDYLEENGITEWEDFVGCQEVLTLHYEFVGKGKYLNIDQDTRQFVYEAEDGDGNGNASAG